MSSRAASGVAAAAALILALSAAGCGGKSAAARKACLNKAFFLAEAQAVRTEFNAGRLGTRNQVVKELVDDYRIDGSGNIDIRAVKKNLFFDANDKIIPWNNMTFRQKAEFDEWVSNSQRVFETIDRRYPHLREHVNATAKC